MQKKGKTVGPYILVEKLGRGSFGEVWLAEKQTSLITAQFALKFPNDYEIELDSIRQEAELWQKASGHPNILPLIEANIYDGRAIIVSEYVKDGSLDELLRKGEIKLPPQEKTVEIMSGILDGLEHLHNRRIVHRDLKPANILLQEGKPRLTDFGVSKILKNENNTTKNISGTVAYMSPEALEGKRNFQSDLWSASVIFYQMLTGKMPFQTPDQISLMLAIVSREPFPLPAGVKDKWGSFFQIALNKNADLRFQTASQMKQAIEYAWNNLSLEPVTRKYQSLERLTDKNESAKDFPKLQTNDFENETTLLDLKQTEILNKVSNSDYIKQNNKKKMFVGFGVVVLALILSIGGYLFLTGNSLKNNATNQSSIVATEKIDLKKKYAEMSEAEKSAFISVEANRIVQVIKQGEESEISETGKDLVKQFVDNYAARLTKGDDTKCWVSNTLPIILKRGSQITPVIDNEFRKNELSPLIGIYLAMIESNFCPCLQSPTGPLGLFQFTASQSDEYGLRSVKGSSPSNPDGRCDPKLSSKAASVRMKKLIAEDFGDGKNKVTFAVSGFNANNLNLKDNIELTKQTREGAISFWELLENKGNLSEQFIIENSKYVPKFLAGVIIGENPQVFGIDMPPLSSATEKINGSNSKQAK